MILLNSRIILIILLNLIILIIIVIGDKGDKRRFQKEGLLIIPGVGRSDRLLTVAHNLRLLERNYLSEDGNRQSRWDCIIYVYAMYNNTEFWTNQEIPYITNLCSIVENPNKRVTENLYLVQPQLIKRTYRKIFILLDDCKLLTTSTSLLSFELDKIINIMDKNELTIASPMVVGANKGGGQEFRSIMYHDAQPGTEGYVSVFVELFAWVMTMPAYHALWDLLYPAVNPYGWGYDFWYDNYAASRVKGHKMGIISTIKVNHEQDFSSPNGGRTETATMDQKWSAVLEQEKVYLSHFGVNLKKYREELRLKNSSWNGAVIGYLN